MPIPTDYLPLYGETCVSIGAELGSLMEHERQELFPGFGSSYGAAETYFFTGHVVERLLQRVLWDYPTVIELFSGYDMGVFSYDVADQFVQQLKSWDEDPLDDQASGERLATAIWVALRPGPTETTVLQQVTNILQSSSL